MRTGKTKSGFEFEIEESALDNMELIDALAEIDDGNAAAITKVSKLLFGNEQRKRIYDHIRTQDGNVPISAFTQEVLEIFSNLKEGKNS